MDRRRWDQCVTPKTGVGLRRRRKRSGDGDGAGDGGAVCGYRRHSICGEGTLLPWRLLNLRRVDG
jgi:hypothetical protein